MKNCAICNADIPDHFVGLKCYPCRNDIAKKYREMNRERIRTNQSVYRLENKDLVNARQREYVKTNKTSVVASQSRYYKEHREEIRRRVSSNPETRIRARKYRDANREAINRSNVISKMKKYNEDGSYRAVHNLRNRMSSLIRNSGVHKNHRFNELVGCTPKQLKDHLESLFQQGMTWENKGRHGWHIDHIRPCSSFDLTDLEQQRECFNYKNLQPLWWYDNLSKGSKVT